MLGDADTLPYLLLVGLPVLVGISLVRSLPSVRGRCGEFRIARELRGLDKDRYRVLSDLLVETPSGTSQIDHVVISRSGVHVIETKNYRGWIHGTEGAELWTQSIYRTKIRFANPVKQNLSHVRALKGLLSNMGEVRFYPIVVFTGSGELKNVDTRTPVVYKSELLQTIRKVNVELLSDTLMTEIEARLLESTKSDKRSRKAHVRRIRTKVSLSPDNGRELICPRCGARMVSRVGQFGSFYGCSNYPRCRHTMHRGHAGR